MCRHTRSSLLSRSWKHATGSLSGLFAPVVTCGNPLFARANTLHASCCGAVRNKVRKVLALLLLEHERNTYWTRILLQHQIYCFLDSRVSCRHQALGPHHFQSKLRLDVANVHGALIPNCIVVDTNFAQR